MNAPGVPAPTIAVSYVAAPGLGSELTAAILELGAAVTRELRTRAVQVCEINAADPPSTAAEVIDRADGLLVLGGADIDPAVYGQRPGADNLFTGDRDADDYEARMVRAAAAAGKPVFGICRGSQLINVAFGGTLIQNLGSGLHVNQVPAVGGDVEQAWTNHDVLVQPGSRLEAVLGVPRLDVRVGHHQAVDGVGEGLVVAARAQDGVVEAVEATAGWIVGVQWHPEERHADPQMFARLVDGFLEAVQRERAARGIAAAPHGV